MRTGLLKDAEHNFRLRIEICLKIKDEYSEAIGYEQLGNMLIYRGAWKDAEVIHKKGFELGRKIRDAGIEMA